MLVSAALSAHVSNKVRQKGADYFRGRAVSGLSFEGGVLSAVVRGAEGYVVHIEVTQVGLQGGCTCPFFFDRLALCKHIWATLLAAEAQRFNLWPPGASPGDLTFEPIDADSDDDLEVDIDDYGDDPQHAQRLLESLIAANRAAGTIPAARAQPKGAEPWRLALAAVSQPSLQPATHPRSGELVFVVDVAASKAAGALVVDTMLRSKKANGDWTKPKAHRLTPSTIAQLPDTDLKAVLERMMGARPYYDYNASADFGELRRFQLRGAVLRDAAPALGAPNRCLARAPGIPPPPPPRPPRPTRWGYAAYEPPPPLPPPVDTPLVYDDGPAWDVSITVDLDENASQFVVDGSFRRGEDRMAFTESLLVLPDGFLIARDRLSTFDPEWSPWVKMLVHGPIRVPRSERAALIDAMLTRPLALDRVPDELRCNVETPAPRPRLRLTPARYLHQQLEGALTCVYDGLEVPADAPQTFVRTTDAARIVRRDLDAERVFAETLATLGFRTSWSQARQAPAPHIATKHMPRVVRTLLAERWRVEAEGVVYRQPVSTSMRLSSGIDWLDLEGHADYGDERVALPALLAALSKGDGYVTLGDGSLGLLPEEWLRRQKLLAGLGHVDGDRVRFRSTQVALLDALLADREDVTVDERFAKARTEVQAFDGIAAADAPASFHGTLRGYQREGLAWLLFLRRFGFGGCLADDMGLGKTVMVLALAAAVRAQSPSDAAKAARPFLVVAPRSLIFNWQHEAARFTPGLRVLDYTGMQRGDNRHRLGEADIVLTTYGTMRRDIEHLSDVAFDCVVLDEAQAIKNAASASAKAARLLRADHRLALSGTPIENHLGELWSLFEFLNPGLLGSASAFQGLTGRGSLDESSLVQLAHGLRPFILRRTKQQVAPELPQKTEQTLYCELEKPQRALYEELRAHYRRSLLDRVEQTGLARAKIQILEALLRLRQAACHVGLLDKTRTKEPSAKLDVLLPHIVQAVEEGHKTLVFSQFTSLLAILREQLDAQGVTYEYLDGRTRDREAKVRRFQEEPECHLFLISLKAGGVGLNLTAAEYVFLLDPWWNPAVEAQAIDRAHRIGQSRHVFAYRLIAKGTVEEHVLQLQQSKRQLADAVLSADGSLLKELKREDLELLLS